MKSVRNIFLNPEEKRMRFGWRISIQTILFLAITVGREILIRTFHTNAFLLSITYIIYLAAGLGLAWLMAKSFDRRSFADYGFHINRSWWMDLVFGLVLGAVLITGIFISMRAVGWIVIVRTAVTGLDVPFIVAFLISLLLYVGVAVNEELTFRSYHLKNLSEIFARRRYLKRAIVIAFLVSSAIFGLAHALNPNATLVSTLSLVLAGLLLALPYMLTGEIAISIGLHVTWNFFEGTVYGYGVSGKSLSTRLFSIKESGPSLWTGGEFGPEAGLIGIIWALIGFSLILLWIKLLRNKIKLYTPLAEYNPKEIKEQYSNTTIHME